MPSLWYKRAASQLTNDGSSAASDESFFQQHATYFYIVFGGICAVVLAICFYSLWRGPQRSFFPCTLCLCCRRKKDRPQNEPARLGVQGMWAPEEATGRGGWRKTVYLTDLKNQSRTLQKGPPNGTLPGRAESKNGNSDKGEGSTARKGEAKGRMGNKDWAGTVSSFGHPASMMSSGPDALGPQLERHRGAPVAGPSNADSPEMMYTPRGRMEGQAWAPPDRSYNSSPASTDSWKTAVQSPSKAFPFPKQPPSRQPRGSIYLNRAGYASQPSIHAPPRSNMQPSMPAHARSRSVGASRGVPSPLATLPAIHMQAKDVLMPSPPPRLSPRVQFSPLPLPMRDNPWGFTDSNGENQPTGSPRKEFGLAI